MADLECAETLVAMRTMTIEEMSKEDRLAAVILSVMKDYGIPTKAATNSPSSSSSSSSPHEAAAKRSVDHDAEHDHSSDNPRKRRKLDNRPAPIDTNKASTKASTSSDTNDALPTPPTTNSDIDEGPPQQHPSVSQEQGQGQQRHDGGHVGDSAPTDVSSPVSTLSTFSAASAHEPEASKAQGRGRRLSARSGQAKSGRQSGGSGGSPPRKRYKLGEEGGKIKSRGEQIGACMKAVFNEWEMVFDPAKGEYITRDSASVLADGIYRDALSVLPSDGPGSLHHEEEMAMAADAGFTQAKGNLADYYVRKYRTALGFVFLAEHNLRLYAAATSSSASSSSENSSSSNNNNSNNSNSKKPNYIDFNKTQAQMFPRGDVNVTSRWFSKWKAWGWFPDMKTGSKELNPELESMLPRELRERLIEQAIEYEDANRDCKQWRHYPAIART